MVVAIIRSKILPEMREEYYQQADAMAKIAMTMPGFISYKGYTAPDGERVSVHEWESAEQLQAWRMHPEHVAIQKIGRERYYEEYTIYVMESPRVSHFKRQQPLAR